MYSISLRGNGTAKTPPILPVLALGLMALIHQSGRPPQTRAAEALPATSESVWQLLDDFDGVQPSWQIQPRESLRSLLQRRTDRASHHGLRCEHIAVLAGKGDETIYATYPIPPSMAIGEFQASIWLCGNRPGFQLMARVRLPRTLDDKTGEPVSLLVEGDAYVDVGAWQRLSLQHVDLAMADKTRALRAEWGPHVDPAEAFVDLIVLNMYGGAGMNRLWVDDLMLAGVVPSRRATSDQVQKVSFHVNRLVPRVRVEHGLLFVNEQEFVPRLVPFHGESFRLLAQLGFNCVWLNQPATDRQLAQAREHDLWLICPAPDQPPKLEDFDRVLAWCVGHDLTSDEITKIRRVASDVRSRDAKVRPLLLSAADHHDAWSRYVDIVVDTGSAGAFRRRLGYPIWNTIRLHRSVSDLSWVRVRDQVHESIAAGYKGVVVSSHENLEQPSSRRQRHLMELLNMEFELLKPWVAVNQFDAVRIPSAAEDYRVAVLRNGHTQLALVRNHDETLDALAALPSMNVVIPTSRSQAVFLIESDRLSPLTPRHMAGGVSLPLPGTLTTARILFADQPNVVRHLTQHLQGTASRAHELLLEIARAETLEMDQLISQLDGSDADQAELRARIHHLHGLLPHSAATGRQEIRARQLETAFSDLERIRRTLRALQRTED